MKPKIIYFLFTSPRFDIGFVVKDKKQHCKQPTPQILSTNVWN
jgi:hypothetical protein